MATCPLPPQFPNSHLNIPPFLRSHHPYTKWMINMIRGGSHYRLTTMVRERPELFQQIFQVADQPDLIGNDARDSQSMFHRNAVLYLNPLCLAIYLKEEKSVEIILRSGVNHAYQKSYATDVFSRGVAGGDIIEILPVCVAIRREFYEAIGSLCSVAPPFMKDGQALTLDISRPLELHYESKASQKVYKFRDTLHYGTETMKTRLSINVSSLLESLITIRPELWQPQVLNDDGFGQKISLFRRIARVAYYEDPECRKSHNLISALETLFKNRCFVELQPTPDTKAGFVARIQSLDPMIMDQDCAIALLMGLYYRMHCKVKNGPMNSLADIIRRALVATKWQKTFLRLPVEHLQKIFSCVPERVALPTDSLLAIKTHINIINEKEQDSAINLTGAGRIPASELRNVGDDCALLRVRQSANRFSKPPSLSSYIQASSSGMPRRQAAAQPAPGGLETMSDFDESGMAGQEMPPSIPPPLMQQMLQQQQQQQQQQQHQQLQQQQQMQQQLQQQQQMQQQLQQQLQQHRQQLISSRSPYIGNDTADTADHEEDERSEDLNSFERELVKHMYSSTAGRQQQQQQPFAASDMGDVRHQAGKPGRAGLLQQQQQQQLFDAFDAAASSAADSAY